MPRPSDAPVTPRPITLARAGDHPVVGGMFIAAQFLVLNAIGLFATAYIIRELGALRYGQWATAAALAAAYGLITSVGLRTLFVREIARQPESARELLAAQLSLRILLGAVAATSALVTAFVLGYPPVVIACTAVGCLWILLSVISSTFADVLQSLERFGSYSAVALASGIAVTATSVIAVALGCGPVGLSFAYLAAPATSTLLYWRSVQRHVDISLRWETAGARKLLREARLVGFSQIATAVRDRAEQLLVPRLVGLEAFGVFSAGAMIGDRLAHVPDAVCTAFYPRISRTAAGTAHGAVESSVTRMLTIGLVASMPPAVLGSYLAPSIAGVLLPNDAETCRRIIAITVWAVPFSAVSLGMSYALQAAGRHDDVARLGLRATVISAGACAGLITWFGITGASWAVLARPATVLLALLPAFRRAFPGVLRTVPLTRIALSTTALAGVCLVAGSEPIWPALLVALTGAATYGAALLAARVFTIEALVRLFTPAAHNMAANLKS
jgi:O-antigen/teichoic acid export membrane protein